METLGAVSPTTNYAASLAEATNFEQWLNTFIQERKKKVSFNPENVVADGQQRYLDWGRGRLKGQSRI